MLAFVAQTCGFCMGLEPNLLKAALWLAACVELYKKESPCGAKNHAKYNVSRETRCDWLGIPPFFAVFFCWSALPPSLTAKTAPSFFLAFCFSLSCTNKNPQNIAKYLLRPPIFFCRRLFKQKVNKKAVFHVKHRLFIAPRFFLCCLM